MKAIRATRLLVRTFGTGIASLVLFAGTASAQDVIKANNTDALNLTTSWVGGVVPGSGNVAVWDSTVTAANSTALGADTTWLGVKVTNPGGLVTIGADANVLTLGTSGVDLSAATQSVYLNGASTSVGANNQTWNVASTSYLRLGNGNLDGVLSGSGTITISGSGLVDLNPTTTGASNFSGKWIVNSGATLRTTRNSVSADWDALGSNTSADAVTLNGGTLAVGGFTGSGAQGNWTWNNPITVAAASTISGQLPDATATTRTLILGGAITGSGDLTFAKNQSSTMTFSIRNFAAVPGVRTDVLGTGNVTINGVALELRPSGTGAGTAFTLNNNFKLIGGTLIDFDGNDVTLKGTITLEGANTIQSHWNGKDLILDGALVDGGVAGSVTFRPGASEGDNAIYLNGTNTYTGGSTAISGRTYITGAQGLGTGQVTGDGGQVLFQPTTAGITSTVSALRTRSDVHLNNNVLLDITSGNLGMRQTGGFWIKNSAGTVGRLTSSSGTLAIASVDANWVTTATGTFNFADHQIQGYIVDYNAGTPLAVTKTGDNQVQFTRANTYTGGTTISGGRINASNVAALGTGTVTVKPGGQAWLTQGSAIGSYANNFVISGTGGTEGEGNLGAIRFVNSTLAGNLTVATAGARIGATGNATGTIAGTLTGTTALEINSTTAATATGSITIAGNASDFTGTVTVSKGALTIANAFGGNVTMAAGATLTNNGTIAGDYTHTAGTLQGTGTFSGNVTFNGTAATDVVNIVPGPIQVDGDLTLAGSTTVRASGLFGTVPVATYGGSLTGDETNLALENPTAFRAGTAFDASTPGVVNLVIVGNPITWTAATNRNWSTSTTDLNWDNAGNPDYFYQSDDVSFGDTGVGTVTMVGMLAPASITFTNTVGNDYVLAGGTDGRITGLTGITKTGDGNLTIGGINGQNYSGPINLQGTGLVTLATRDAFGATSGVTIAAGAQVELNGQAPGSVAGGGYSWTIEGEGTDGAGGLGVITNSGGDIYANSGIKSLILTGDAEIGSNNGRFDVGRHEATATFGTINGAGFTLAKVGTNAIVLRAPATDITYVVNGGRLSFEDFDTSSGTNPITVNAGILASYGTRTFPNDLALAAATTLQNLGAGTGTWTGAVALGGTSADSVTLDAGGQNLVLSGVMSGDSNLFSIGGSYTTLAGTANTLTGKLVVSGGNLLVAADGSLGAVPGALVADAITLQNAGWFGVADGVTSVTLDANRGILLPIAGDNAGGSLIPGAGVTLTVNGPVSGLGDLWLENAGTAILKGGTTHTGITRVQSAGTLVLDARAYTGMSQLQVAANLNILPGASITTGKFRMSDGGGGTTVVNQSGGSVTATDATYAESNQNAVMLGHWSAATTYNLTGGTFNVPNAPVLLGWDGQVTWNIAGGTASIQGINGTARNNPAALNLNAGGRLNIGSFGIAALGTNKAINLNGGTLGASADWSTTKGMALTGTSTINTLDSADATTPRTITLSGALTGTGGFTKTGAGTLVLNNTASAIGGTMQVNEGTLMPGTISVGTFNLNGGTTSFMVGTATDLVTAPNFAITSPSTISLVPREALTVPVSYTLVDYTGAIGGNLGDVTLATNPHITAALEDDTTNTVLKVNITAADSVVWRGTSSGTWDVETTENWVLGSDGTTATKYYDFDVVKFDDSGLAAPAVTLAGVIQPSLLTVENTTGTYTFQGDGITGTTGLTKSGAGNLTLHNTNTYTGAVTINGGTVTVGDGTTNGTLGGTGTITANAGGTLAVNRSDTVTLNRVVTGEGSLVQNGSGTLAIPVRQTYTGGTTVNAGIVDLTAGGGAGGTINGTATVNTGGILRLSTGDATGYGGGTDALKIINLAGGAMDINTTANQTLGSAVINMTGGAITGIANTNLDFFGGASALNTLASATTSTIGGTAIDIRQTQGAVFTVEDGPAAIDLDVASLVTNNAPLNNVPGTGGDYGANKLEKRGAGLMRLTNTTNNWHGGTELLAGTVSVPAMSCMGTGYIAVKFGGVFQYTGADTVTDTRNLWFDNGAATIDITEAGAALTLNPAGGGLGGTNGGLITKAGPGALTIGGVIAAGGATSVAVTGGTLTLTAVNTYTGDTTVDGTFVLPDNAGLAFAPAANGVCNKVTGSGTATLNGDFTINLAGASLGNGNNWTLVDATTKTFGASFTVVGWTEASHVWTLVDGTRTWTFTEATGVLSLEMPGYESWAATNAGGQAANLDFDNDGVANGVEFFMGETGSSFTANPGVVDGKVTWPKSAEFQGDYAVETSPDLAVWTAAVGVVDNGTSVEYTLPTGEVRIFVRLLVTPQ